MALFPLADRVKDTSTAQSGSTITLSGTAPTGFQSFNAGVGDGNYAVYCVYDTAGNWEIGYGVYTNSAKTLGRLATPFASSNAGAQVTTFSGTVTVILGPEGAMLSGSLGNNLSGLASPGGGQRYFPPAWTGFAAAPANAAVSAGNTYYCPIFIPQWFTTLSLRINIGTLAATSATAQLGLFSNSGGGPLTVLGTSSSIVAGNQGGGATGEQSASITLSSAAPNPPALYWAAVAVSGAANPSMFKGGSLMGDPRVMGTRTIANISGQGGYIWTSNTALGNVTQASLTDTGSGNVVAITAAPSL